MNDSLTTTDAAIVVAAHGGQEQLVNEKKTLSMLSRYRCLVSVSVLVSFDGSGE
jgi:hypothetical protein